MLFTLQFSNASVDVILPWLLQKVPKENMDALQEQGVDWNFIRSEINALSLGTTAFLPTTGLSTHIVNVHGDSHVGNIMRTSTEGELRLIDFDMCTRGQVRILLRTFIHVSIFKRTLFLHSKHLGRNRIRVHRATTISCRIQPRAGAPFISAANVCRRLPPSSGYGTKVSVRMGKWGCLFNNVLLFLCR